MYFLLLPVLTRQLVRLFVTCQPSTTAIVTASLLDPSLWSGTSCRTARHWHSNGRGLDSCSPGTAITNQQQTLVPSLLVLRSLLTSIVRPLLANLWTGCKMETCRLSVHLWGSSSVSIYSILQLIFFLPHLYLLSITEVNLGVKLPCFMTRALGSETLSAWLKTLHN